MLETGWKVLKIDVIYLNLEPSHYDVIMRDIALSGRHPTCYSDINRLPATPSSLK